MESFYYPRLIVVLGENDNKYRLGNKYSLNDWSADWLSFSGRLELASTGSVKDSILILNLLVTPSRYCLF